MYSNSATTGHLAGNKAIKLSTYGVNFVGTPHQGGNGVFLASVLHKVLSAGGHTNQNTLQHLDMHSEWLQKEQRDYLSISGDFETICYYETYETLLPGNFHELVRRPRYIGGAPAEIIPRSFRATQL